MTCNTHQQPWNGIRTRRIDAGHGLTRNFTSVVVLPRRSGVVPADNGSLLVMQLCFGGLQGPGELAVRARLTHVYLRARRVNPEDNLLSGRRFDLVGHIRARATLPTCLSGDTDQNGE